MVCKTGPYMPAVFTAHCDNTVGEPIPNNPPGNLSTDYFANPALKIMSNGQDLHDLRISYAQKGVFFYDYCAGSNPNKLRHVQFQRCSTAVQCNGYTTTYQNLIVRNALICNSSVGFYGYSFNARVEHLTMDTVTQLANDYSNGQYGPSSIWLTNSLLALVGPTVSVTRYETSCESPSTRSVFASNGAGDH